MLDNGISALRREYRPRSQEDQDAAERLGVELDELGGSYLGCIDRCAVVVLSCILRGTLRGVCARGCMVGSGGDAGFRVTLHGVVPGCCCSAELDKLRGIVSRLYLGLPRSSQRPRYRVMTSPTLVWHGRRLLLCVTMPLPEWESLTHVWGGLSLWPTWLADPSTSANNGPNSPKNSPNILAGMSPREPPRSPAEKRRYRRAPNLCPTCPSGRSANVAVKTHSHLLTHPRNWRGRLDANEMR